MTNAVLREPEHLAKSAKVKSHPDPWSPVDDILQAALADAKESEQDLSRLLAESNKMMAPLCDPLSADLGLNRWLAEDREEAYSDWLQWILQSLPTGDQLLRVLQLWNPQLSLLCRGITPEIDREYEIPDGRLDIVIRFDNKLLIVIEIKKTAAEVAEVAKHTGYRAWMDGELFGAKYPLLLSVGEANEEVCEGFLPRSWDDFCISLRSMVKAVKSNVE